MKISNKETLTTEEQIRWDEGKGARNLEDWNRIATNSQYLIDMLIDLKYSIDNITQKSDWIKTEFPNPTDIQKILDDTQRLKNAFYVKPNTPQVPTIPINHYSKLNDIEKIIDDIHSMVYNMINAFRYSGEDYAGE